MVFVFASSFSIFQGPFHKKSRDHRIGKTAAVVTACWNFHYKGFNLDSDLRVCLHPNPKSSEYLYEKSGVKVVSSQLRGLLPKSQLSLAGITSALCLS